MGVVNPIKQESLTVVTGSTAEPVTTADAKSHLNIGSTDDDTYIAGLVVAATRYAEEVTRRVLMPRTYRLTLDDWPVADMIELPRSPVLAGTTAAPTQITYVASDNTTSTFGSTKYFLDTDAEPGRIVLKYNESWPTTVLRPAAAVKVQFRAGYSGSTAVPSGIKHAIKMVVGSLYENREDTTAGVVVRKVPMAADSLLALHRVPSVP